MKSAEKIVKCHVKVLAISSYCAYNVGRMKLSGLWLKVDASRRQNDPRNPAKVLVSMVRLRCKSVQEYLRELVVGHRCV